MRSRKSLLIVFFLFFLLYCAAGFYWKNHQRPTGDEPHYLLIARSIVVDHDVDVKNNYDNSDYVRWGYAPDTLDRHISVNSRPPHGYSVHNIGWPLILSPAIAIGSQLALKVFTAALATLLLYNLFLLLRSFSKKDSLPLIITAILGFSPPILIYSSQLGSELFTALLILFAFRKMIEDAQANFYSDIFTILAISYLPWIHVKYLLISLVLFICFALKKLKSPILLLYPLSLALMALFFFRCYGSPLPSAQYPLQTDMRLGAIFQGAMALLFDRKCGLATVAPLYFLSFAGFYWLYKENKKTFWTLLATFLSLFIFHAAGATYIGWVPIGRFLLPVIPLLALPLMFTFEKLRWWGKVIFVFFSLWGVAAGYFLVRHPDLNYPGEPPPFLTNFALRLPYHPPLVRLFPRLLELEKYPVITPQSWLTLSLWLGGVLLVSWLIIFRSKNKES